MFVIGVLLLSFLHNAFTADTSCGVLQHVEKNESDVGVWSWHVAVLNSSHGYVTSGSIISEWFVLTVAHVTFTNKSVQKAPNELVVAMGITDLDDPQNFTRKSNISSITRYDGYDQRPGINDLALLKTSVIITFNNYVSAVCLWPNSKKDDLGNAKVQMSIVGLSSADVNGKSKITLSEANVTVSNFEICYKLSEILSNKNYCTVNISKTNICLENGIAGIYIHYQGVWYLRGIITPVELNTGLDSSCRNLNSLHSMELRYYQKWIERHALPTKHNLLGIEDCGIGMYSESNNQLVPPHHPWITQLAYVFWGRFNVTDCHGVLIHPEFVVTSSKCTENRKYRKLLHVILGANSIGKNPYDKSRNNIQAIEITEHLFSQTSSTFEYGFDTNVLRLARKADITENVKPVCLPSSPEATSHYSMVAWNRGGEHPKQLEFSLMQSIPFNQCHSEYLNIGVNLSSGNFLSCFKHCKISDVQGSQSCLVDRAHTCKIPLSGSPLFYTKHDGIHTYTYLVGIKSFGPANCQDSISDVFNDIVSARKEIETLVRWKAWFDDDDDDGHLLYDYEDVTHTVHFELDEEGNVVEDDSGAVHGDHEN